MQVQIKNNEIIRFGLPETGTLENGCTVSGYNTLPVEQLKHEGWVELIEEIPTVTENQHLEHLGYEVLKDSVVSRYKAVDNEVIEPTVQAPTLEERLQATEQAITALMGV
jgi:hypothetical protein